eukprot:CAMPEP_0184670004 /NCGR_PEP_ID=MMETSP0308-20130426/80073_1 /TAXON_ID=38269 /ORGANISM="Gloeochaete witrockiana, Strain SAG 46.84" /LENGTH=149 /DNA_ID=CAMNT_0027116537 /DNA_START=671 /DNA_END=1120 /DNA_ORIENTATION=+
MAPYELRSTIPSSPVHTIELASILPTTRLRARIESAAAILPLTPSVALSRTSPVANKVLVKMFCVTFRLIKGTVPASMPLTFWLKAVFEAVMEAVIFAFSPLTVPSNETTRARRAAVSVCSDVMRVRWADNKARTWASSEGCGVRYMME